MASDSNTYTFRRPPDWLIAGVVVLMGGGLGFASNQVAGGTTDTTAHNVSTEAHPAMLSEVSHLEVETGKMRAKMDTLLQNQIAICVKLDVVCAR
ncbi:hypothetical protein LCGC14_1424180 [marine sediment metagenome]|uniref:Uncharacterized protein n=1 Tax=marine sediment metagenome TaxID=412755 RepID=A0A0F9MS74_9ZZZZ